MIRTVLLVCIGLVGLILCLASSVQANRETFIHQNRAYYNLLRRPHKYCGQTLHHMISLTCMFYDEEYCSPTSEKRTSLPPDDDGMQSDQPQPAEKTNLMDLLTAGSRRRVRRGIVDDCCHRPCTITTLRSMCCPRKASSSTSSSSSSTTNFPDYR